MGTTPTIKENTVSEHLSNCTTGPDDTEFNEGQTEYHIGPDRCPACDENMAAVHEAEAYAEFGMGWVTGGGDPADVGAAWSQEKAIAAERDEADRNRRIEDEAAEAAYLRSVTRPKDRPVTGWRKHHVNFFGVGPAFKGDWAYEPGCGCAKCFNHDLFIQDCLGEWEIV